VREATGIHHSARRCGGVLTFLRPAGPTLEGSNGEVCLIGSRLFCLRAEPSLDLIKVAKMYQAVLIP
jgi:hypothetical protein